ncbi:MAG: hypothetical protein P8Z49_04875 [Acidobacteriota bacterium]
MRGTSGPSKFRAAPAGRGLTTGRRLLERGLRWYGPVNILLALLLIAAYFFVEPRENKGFWVVLAGAVPLLELARVWLHKKFPLSGACPRCGHPFQELAHVAKKAAKAGRTVNYCPWCGLSLDVPADAVRARPL